MDRSPEPFAVTGAAVIDGTGGPVLPDRTVLVRGGVIERIDPAGAVTPPPGTRRIEGAGRSLLPGFIDTHVHLDFYPPAAVLRGGVTSVRDLGWPAGRLEALRRGAARSPTSSPRLLAAGQMVTSPGGYPSSAAWAPPGTAVEVEGTEQAAAAVAELAAAGASVIKVALDPTRGAPTLPAPTLAAVVAAAAERRLDVTAHVAGPAEVAKALDAGVTELAHWPFGEEPRGDLIRRMAASMTVVPTLHIDPSPARRRGVRAFVAAGGRVVYGTDLGNQGPPPAVDVAELELLVEAGLSPVGAVAAATSHAAEHLGLRACGTWAAARPEFGRTVADPIAPGFPGGRRPTCRRPVRLSRAPVSRPDRWTRPPGFPGAGRTAGGWMVAHPGRSTMVATRFNCNDHRNWFDPGNDCQKVANTAVPDDDADTDHRRGVRRTPPAPFAIAKIPRRAWSWPLDTRAAGGHRGSGRPRATHLRCQPRPSRQDIARRRPDHRWRDRSHHPLRPGSRNAPRGSPERVSRPPLAARSGRGRPPFAVWTPAGAGRRAPPALHPSPRARSSQKYSEEEFAACS